MKPRIKIAIQRKGRLRDGSVAFLKKKGIAFDPDSTTLLTPCTNQPIDLLFVRDDDISEYVSRGVADYGIVGRNVLYEKSSQVQELEDLDFGHCKLIIAVPEETQIKTIEDLEAARIATSYPKLLRKFLKEQNINAAIIPIQGSVEVTPSLNMADAICDLTQTGKTLQENKLTAFFTILESQAVLIGASDAPFNI